MSETKIVVDGGVEIGGERFTLLGGPCVIESEAQCVELAGQILQTCKRLGVEYVFKASFDKANRTSLRSFRGPGIERGLASLEAVREAHGVPVLTDVHEVWQAREAGAVVDVLQIPAFLCRQTDLLVAAAETSCVVNVKKGQFLAPHEMEHVVSKLEDAGTERIVLTERGSSFGYNTLIVDFRSLPQMRVHGYPVIFDATHSVQQPGGAGGRSGGQRQFVPYLARAAAAVGVDGVFMEIHPDPDSAPSDGPNMVPLAELEALLEGVLAVRDAVAPLPPMSA